MHVAKCSSNFFNVSNQSLKDTYVFGAYICRLLELNEDYLSLRQIGRFSARGDSYSRSRINEYTVTVQRAANCKTSTTVMRATHHQRQRQRHLAHETPRCALVRHDPSRIRVAPATHVTACVRPTILRGLYSRVRAILF